MRAAASPRPPLASPKEKKDKDATMQSLLRMYELGVLSKDELRQMVFKKMHVDKKDEREPIRSQPSSSTPTKPKPIESEPLTPKNCKPVQDSPFTVADYRRKLVEPVKIIRRKTSPTTCEVRKLVKNITRQRFFIECTKRDSPLWHETKGGKQSIHRLLFETACKHVVDKLYEEHPVQLRAVSEPELKRLVHWQVGKDRNNWVGKTPKRAGFVGTMAPFDFVAEKQTIDKALAEATDLTRDDVKVEATKFATTDVKVEAKLSIDRKKKVEAKLSIAREKKVEAKLSIAREKDAADVSKVMSCFTCGLGTWTGKVEECPPTVGIAFPLGSSWGTYNVQPYCQACWKAENSLLTTMGAEHKAVGKKRKLAELKHQVVTEANNALIRSAILEAAATATPSNKKGKKANQGKKAKQGKKVQKAKKVQKTKKVQKAKKVQKPKKKKMQLGGCRGFPPPKPQEVERWQVRALRTIMLTLT